MSESTARMMTGDAARSREGNSVAASLALVVGFWWAATGLTLAMQQHRAASDVSVTVTTLLAALGCSMVIASRDRTTVRGVRSAFLGSALLWWWCTTLFYAGIGVDIPEAVTGAPGSFELARQAILATLVPDLLGVVTLIFVGVCVRNSANRAAFGTFAIFFGTLQTAKLNIFSGVRNSGADWLPPHLAGLTRFFGPPHNSALLPVTLLLLLAICIGLARGYRRATSPYRQHAHAMLTVLMALAFVEHVFLGLPFMLPFWNAFARSN